MGNHSKLPYFTYTGFFPYTPSNQFFFTLPRCVFLGAQLLSIFFLNRNLFLTPNIFWFCKQQIFFMKEISLLTIMNCEVQPQCLTNLNSIKTINQGKGMQLKHFILHCEMKYKYDIEVNLCQFMFKPTSVWSHPFKFFQ